MTDRSKEPVAGLSAASSCIRLSLCPQSTFSSAASPPPSRGAEELPFFRPVYTHQIFEGERILGWRPTAAAERQSRRIHRSWRENGAGDDNRTSDDGGLHPSYRRRPSQDPSRESRIDVHVLLSPLCERCRVEIRTEEDSLTEGKDDPPKKKAKVVSFGGSDSEAAADREPGRERMDVREIVRRISSAVPPIVSVRVDGTLRNDWLPSAAEGDAAGGGSRSESDEKEHLGSRLIGRVLETYHRKITGGTEEAKFAVTLADGSDPSTARYHSAVQPLASWYIESADGVDVAERSRGSWKVMYLFRNHVDGAVSLAGYVTLLHLHSPFRKPPGIIVRLCQAFILPPYHRAGHGSTMLHSLHSYADAYHANNETPSPGMPILEINVEDPAPAFVALRDSVDYQRFLSICSSQPSGTNINTGGKFSLDYLEECDVTDKDNFLPVSEERLASVAAALKITKRQAQILHEMYKLAQVEQWEKQQMSGTKDTDGGGEDELIQQVKTNYRLMVKRSLRSFRMEELGACQGGKEEQKALLGRWFDETFGRYRRVLSGLDRKSRLSLPNRTRNI